MLDWLSSRTTSTVSSPSLTASGICVSAKMLPNLPSAPATPPAGSGKASASCMLVTQYVDRSATNAPKNTATISGAPDRRSSRYIPVAGPRADDRHGERVRAQRRQAAVRQQ